MMKCYLFERRNDWGGWTPVAVYVDKTEAQTAADKLGEDAEHSPRGNVITLPLKVKQ